MVSKMPSSWDIFFLKDTSQITNGVVSLARSNGGHWTVNFSEFSASRVEFEGKPQTIYYYKSLPKKHNFCSRLLGK